MPNFKKGAPARAKKARWTPEQRESQGRAVVRPRGATASRPQRERDVDNRERRDDVAKGRSTRPNWEPRDKAADPRRPRWADDRAPRGDRADRAPRTDRPARDDRFGRDDRPRRDDRPARSFDDRPVREGRDDRPRREDRPFRDDRAPRSSRDDRPARSFRDDRPARDERPARDDRPRRDDRFDRSERPARQPRSFDDRPRREDRPFRDERPFRDDRPRRDDRAFRDDRPRRDDRASAPFEQRTAAPVDDVVLERLEAQAVAADEVEGVTFGDLGLGANLVRTLAELGAESPFPIQAATIPQVLAGRDVLGRGRTGSGKTIAFGAPLVERLMKLQLETAKGERRKMGRAPRALILAPTRELALQIDRTVQPLAQSVGLFTTQIYGGVPYARQLGAIQRGVDIVIGTPGRIGDLFSQGRLDLSQVVITVLDEADHMCELGFLEPVQDLLRRTSDGGQKLLFSATLDSGVASLVEEFLVDPSVHEVAGEDAAHADIRHVAFLLDQRDKQAVLVELAAGPGKKLVFARTRAFAEQLADMLDDEGIRAESIHGDLNQSRRTRALEKFSSGRVTVLVATDVAARGIHVDDVELVIQADAPDEYKSYLHRAGRTGRAGKKGTVVTLVPRNRRRRTEDLLARAEISPEWRQVAPGNAAL